MAKRLQCGRNLGRVGIMGKFSGPNAVTDLGSVSIRIDGL
jgi:hypothetical protein